MSDLHVQPDSELADAGSTVAPPSPWPWASIGFTVACVVVFIIMTTGGVSLDEPKIVDLLRYGANSQALSFGGEPWRLFTSMFIHIGVMHLVFNCIALLDIGSALERHIGFCRLVAIYILSGIAGSLVSAGMTPTLGHTTVNALLYTRQVIEIHLSAGASGAILGLAGAYLIYLLSGDLYEPGEDEKANGARIKNILLTLALTLGYGLMNKGIDNAAHFGGLGAGLLLGVADIIMAKRIQQKWLVALILLIVVGGIFYMLLPGATSIANHQDEAKEMYQLLLDSSPL